MQVPDRKQWIFQVVEESETEDQIKLSEIAKSRVLSVAFAKGDIRETPLSLFHILAPPVDAEHSQTNGLKEATEMAETAAHVNGGAEAEGFLQFRKKTRDHCAPRAVQCLVVLMIKDSRRVQRCVPPVSREQIETEGSVYRSIRPYSADGLPWRWSFLECNPTCPSCLRYPKD